MKLVLHLVYLAIGFLTCQISAETKVYKNVKQEKEWWQTAVFYQIYPRSFKDSDGDGIGDLKGITQNLEHFVDAGVKAIWLSPIYKSPMVDFGYDISNFREIQKEYGTMEDFETLAAKARNLSLKLILDFVPNHASDQSDYFKLSVNKTNGYEDFFIWDDGLEDLQNISRRLPPSNWVSQFQGSAWQWNDQRKQFYLHQFSVQQPDFNFRNPAVLKEMRSILTFWMDKGADGFRIDALPYLIEAEKSQNGKYPDDPLTGKSGLEPNDLGYTFPYNTKDLDELYDIVYDWKDLLAEYGKVNGKTMVMMTEGYANVSRTMKYYGNDTTDGSDVPFNFDFITELNSKSTARDIVYIATRWLTYMPDGKTANWVFGNHDNRRMATRFGSHMVDALNMLDLLLPGVAITYQGDEIGMEDGYVSWKDTIDVSGCSAGEQHYTEFSRDPERTPFQWDDSVNAGFSTANETWLPVAQNYENLNLAQQKQADKSHYKVYQAMTQARKYPTIQDGDWKMNALSDQHFALIRTLEKNQTFTLVVNMGPGDIVADLSSFQELPESLMVYTASANSHRSPNDIEKTNSIPLTKGEAVVYNSPSKDSC